MEQERILHMALLAGVPVVEYHNEGGVPLLTLRRFAGLIVEAVRAEQAESLLIYAKALGSRVKVENELWQISIGAAPLPDGQQCREWAQRLGIPEDMRTKFRELFGDAYAG